MASRYYTEFPERKVGGGGARPSTGSKGAPASRGPIQEKTANWPKPGPVWGSSFNRATKVPVVKTRPAKHGVD